MIVDFVQKNKELFSADFEISDSISSETLGSLHYENDEGFSEFDGEWTGNLFGVTISLSFKTKSTVMSGINNYYRPCSIIVDGIESGYLHQRTAKSGLFSSFSFHEMEYNGVSYEMYPIGFGNDGMKNPVYFGEKQIAQIEKETVVVNDLHNFRIFSTDDFSAMISALFSCYMYTVAFYKHGIKVTNSTEKNYSKTTSKTLLSKYNPNFKSENFIY